MMGAIVFFNRYSLPLFSEILKLRLTISLKVHPQMLVAIVSIMNVVGTVSIVHY